MANETSVIEALDDDTESIELLDVGATCRFFGGEDSPIVPSTLYRGGKIGRFPKPIKIGPGTSRWLKHECEEKRNQIISERDTLEPEAASK